MNKKKMLIIICIYIGISLMYIYHYFAISIDNIIEYFILTINTLLKLGYNISLKISILLLDENIFKLIFISSIVIYLVQKNDVINKVFGVIDKLLEIIKLIKKVDINGVEIVMDDLKNNLDEQSNLVENMESNQSDFSQEQINDAKLKETILQVMVDCPNIVVLIDKFLNSSSKLIRIPRNSIPSKYKSTDISKIFDVEITGSTLKIKNIKKDRECMVMDIFNELLEKGIIYSSYI